MAAKASAESGAMIDFKPVSELGAFVECLWYGKAAPALEPDFVIEPDGRVDAVLAYDGTNGEALAFGSTTVATRFSPKPGCDYLGIRLRPARSRVLVDERPTVLRNSRCRIEHVGGIDARMLLECAAGARSGAKALRAVAELLRPAVAGLDPRDTLASALVAHVERRSGCVRVSDLAREAGMSERQLERLFVDAVGLPPKLFARIVRYQRVRAALTSGERSGADLALRFGYTDQSHLLRDLRALSVPGC